MRRKPSLLRRLASVMAVLLAAAIAFEVREYVVTGARPHPLLVGNLACSLLVMISLFAVDRALREEEND